MPPLVENSPNLSVLVQIIAEGFHWNSNSKKLITGNSSGKRGCVVDYPFKLIDQIKGNVKKPERFLLNVRFCCQFMNGRFG